MLDSLLWGEGISAEALAEGQSIGQEPLAMAMWQDRALGARVLRASSCPCRALRVASTFV